MHSHEILAYLRDPNEFRLTTLDGTPIAIIHPLDQDSALNFESMPTGDNLLLTIGEPVWKLSKNELEIYMEFTGQAIGNVAQAVEEIAEMFQLFANEPKLSPFCDIPINEVTMGQKMAATMPTFWIRLYCTKVAKVSRMVE